MASTESKRSLQNKIIFFMSKSLIKTFYSPFSWMGINCLKATEPL